MPQDVRKVGDLHAAVLAGWEQQAEFFDSQLGDEGGDWERALIGPVVERLLALPAGAQLLELACGNGVFARRMAGRGIRVTASDLSPEMVRRAEDRSTDGITYAVADANDAAALQALSAEPFDAAVCNMAVMSMPEVAPMYNGVIGLLKPGAPFVVSTLPSRRPCHESGRRPSRRPTALNSSKRFGSGATSSPSRPTAWR